jgi:hypothetical protein
MSTYLSSEKKTYCGASSISSPESVDGDERWDEFEAGMGAGMGAGEVHGEGRHGSKKETGPRVDRWSLYTRATTDYISSRHGTLTLHRERT